METIIIYTDGGVVHDIECIPEDVEVEARNYDVDGLTDRELKNECQRDSLGKFYTAVLWSHDGEAHVVCAPEKGEPDE